MRKFSKILLVFILCAGFFLRIWKLEEFFVFGFDEEVIAFRAKQLIVNHKPFLIGGVTPFRIHLGPLFYYFSSLLLIWPWKLNPLSWGVWAAIIASGVIFLIYQVGKNLFNSRVGLLAAFFQAFSFYQILHDRHYWPLFLNPLFSLLVILSLWKIIKKKINWIFVLSLILSFAWQTDPTNLPLFILVIISWWLFSLPLLNKKVILAGLLFLLSFLPLIIFDIRHQGANIKGLWQFQEVSKETINFSVQKLVTTFVYLPQGLAKLLYSAGQERVSYQRFLINNIKASSIFFIFLTVLILIFIFKKSLKKGRSEASTLLLSLLFLITFMGIIFYGSFIGFDLWNHYLSVLFPIFFLSLALAADHIWKSHWYVFLPLFLIIFISLNLRKLSLYNLSYNFKNKQAAVSWTKDTLKEEKFALESLSRDFRFNGIRYLFYLAGKEPEISFVDPPLFWLYDQETATYYPEKFVVFVSRDFKEGSPEDQLYQEYLKKSLKNKIFEDIEVLIIDNEKQQFIVDY